MSIWFGGDGGSDSVAVVLSTECRALRRDLRPLVWVILEEVALDAVIEGGRLMAHTSARQVAERLGVDPGTAATALRALRERGVVGLEREKGPAGRFGLSVYELRPIAGLSVVQARMAEPLVVPPSVVQPAMATPVMVSPWMSAPHVQAGRSEAPDDDRPDGLASGTLRRDGVRSHEVGGSDSSGVTNDEGSACRPGHSTASAAQPGSLLQCPRQESFDLGSVSS
jgi:DNA-binding transcriptional ArsR family regulator